MAAQRLSAVDYDPFAQAALARVVPVTEPQREVWLADKLGSGGSLAYNESVSLRLRGPLDAAALRAAVRELGERHESLRATVSPSGDELCIAEDFVLELDGSDLSAWDGEGREDAVRARLRHVVEMPFDLERGPLVRMELLSLAPQESLLIITAHHIICDGWSFGVLVHDLAALYARHVGRPTVELDPASSFSQYAQAQAAREGTAQALDDEQYWLSRFADPVADLDLPLDRPRPRQRTFDSRRVDVVLDADLVAGVRKLGARQGASLFASLLAGFTTLVRRLSGQTDVVVGIAAAGQAVGGHDALVGHCVNILPVRIEASPGSSFSAVLAETGATLLDAFEHQSYTFGTLLQKLAIPRDPARLPLVNVLFNLDQAVDTSSVRFPGLEFDFCANARSHEAFELFVNAVPVDGSIRLECQYNRDLYDADSVRRWMASLETLLRAAIAEPDRAWDELTWLAADELQCLRDLQPLPTAYDAGRLVYQRFADQAVAAPDRVAISSGARQITYVDLDRRANAIARALRARAIGRDCLVGVCLEREPDLYAAVLGILKAGAAFVPLDPTYPKERLNFMVDDAGLAAVVSKVALLGTIDYDRASTLLLDADLDQQAWDDGAALAMDDGGATPESPAYVIYTSGSTGKPKGVVVPHRALVNLLCSMEQRPGLSADDRLVAVTTMSFDMSIPELFLPLTVGACVVVASREDARDGMALRRLLESSGATIMQATPSGWRVLVDSGWNGGPGFKALAGGESLPVDLATTLQGRCGELWNMYGPTETTVWSTCAHLRGPAQGVSIGTPIANTSVWVLDPHRQQCPTGVAGEIWIGGDGVTLGYLNRPELTAERFGVDPWADVPGARMYRTGDRGRWRNDGTLEHLGRLDFQVKVRGYRIELGEIEANLANHPEVDHCVVIAREDRPGDVRLVGYVVMAGDAEARDDSAREDMLRAHLHATLPAYMVPQHFVFLAALPLSPNGKVDRKALPAPDVEGQRATERTAPRTDLERAVAAIMEDVLALPGIGVDDDFFALGGHSLLAAQLTSRLNRELGVSLSMRALFDAPTVARMAQLLASDSTRATPLPSPIVHRADQRRAPLSLLQERLWMMEEFNPGQLSNNTPSAHRLTGPLDVALLDRAVRDLAQRQTVLRTTIGVEDGRPMQVVHDDIETGLLQVHDLSGMRGDDREAELGRRLQALVEVPFADLGRAPLFCARLFHMEPGVHVLFFMPHHVIWDGWSFDLLYAQLSETYAALVEARPPVLPALPVTYGDFAAWHRGFVQGPEYARQLEFWRGQLGGQGGDAESRVQALPTDKPRRAGMSGQGRSQVLVVPRELGARLREVGLRMDATLFVTLLTAYCAVMGRMTGQRTMIVGTPVRGRNLAEVEDLMGCFTNLLPIHVRIDPCRPFEDAVRQVKSVVLDSFANPDIRLEDLVGRSGVGGGGLLYQSLFSFQDVRQRTRQWGALRHERVEVFQPSATEDLGMWFIENESGLSGGLVYNADIFHDETITLLRERFLRVLAAVVDEPAQTVESLTRFDDGRPEMMGVAMAVDAAQPAAAVDSARPAFVAEFAATTDTQQIRDPRVRYLVELWSELLGVVVTPADNFFELGGNSMLGVQMAARVASDTGVRIKLVRLAAQDLAEIAADLPASIGSADAAGVGSRLARGVKRLFGRSSRDAES